MNRLLLATPGVQNLDNLIVQANASYPMGFYVLLALLLAALGFLVGNIFTHNPALALLFARSSADCCRS